MSNVQSIYISAQIGLLVFPCCHAILFFESQNETGLILIPKATFTGTISCIMKYTEGRKNAINSKKDNQTQTFLSGRKKIS